MPRVTKVEKARTSPGKCSACGAAINKGDSYFWWKFAYRPKSIRCVLHRPAPKDLTQSAFFSTLYDIQEEDFSGADTAESLESLRDDVAQQLEDLKSETEDKLQNMPDSLQQGSTGELLQERVDALDEAINTLQDVDCTVDAESLESDGDDGGDKEIQIEDRLQEIRDELTEALGSVFCS